MKVDLFETTSYTIRQKKEGNHAKDKKSVVCRKNL